MMADITISYAIANADMTKFKQISHAQFDTITTVSMRMSEINARPFNPNDLINRAAQRKEKELRGLSEQFGEKFESVREKYKQFMIKNNDVLAAEKEIKFFETLIYRGRRNVMARHRKRHRRIYSQLKKLQNDLAYYKNYSWDNLDVRIKNETDNVRKKLKNQNDVLFKKWNLSQNAKRARQIQKINFADGYTWVIKSLKTSGTPDGKTKVECARREIGRADKMEIIKDFIVGQKIQIVR